MKLVSDLTHNELEAELLFTANADADLIVDKSTDELREMLTAWIEAGDECAGA